MLLPIVLTWVTLYTQPKTNSVRYNPNPNSTKNFNWNDDPSVLKEQLPLTPFLYEKPFVEYVKNPFTGKDRKQFLKVSDSLRLVEDKGKYKTDRTMTLKPPYRVTWDDMAKHAALRERQCITVEIVNK